MVVAKWVYFVIFLAICLVVMAIFGIIWLVNGGDDNWKNNFSTSVYEIEVNGEMVTAISIFNDVNISTNEVRVLLVKKVYFKTSKNAEEQCVEVNETLGAQYLQSTYPYTFRIVLDGRYEDLEVTNIEFEIVSSEKLGCLPNKNSAIC